MFPLNCARVRAHTKREMNARKRTWTARKCSFQKCFCTYFIHVFQNTVPIQCCSKEILCALRLWKIRGNIDCKVCLLQKASNHCLVCVLVERIVSYAHHHLVHFPIINIGPTAVDTTVKALGKIFCNVRWKICWNTSHNTNKTFNMVSCYSCFI